MLSMPLSLAPGALPDKLAAIRGAGFAAVDISPSDIARYDGPLAALGAAVREAGLQIAALGPVQGPLSTAKLAAKVDAAVTLGIGLIIVEIADDVGALPQLPELQGVCLALRPSRDSEARVLAWLEADQTGALALALDTYDVLSDGSRPARLRDLDGAKVRHLALTDGPQARMLPGQGTLNLGGVARVLARGGFAGVWSTGAAGPDTVQNAYRAMANALTDAAETAPALRSMAPDLPAKVTANGIEFIEFAVDAAAATALEALLSAMAFRPERQHRTKAVTLWRQGAVNIVINKEGVGHAADAMRDHGACVCDMGLRVSDAAGTVARARALGTESFAQAVGVGELDIPAIRGVGGSVLHFIDERADLHRVWDIEFAPVPRASTVPPAGLRRVDHIAQTMRYDEMQSWLLYYLSTFQMRKSPIVNVADPSGIVRSQAIETPEGEVRLNLNGAADDKTLAGSFVNGRTGAGVQHIAFQTDDIFETSARLTENGFARLLIPENYYTETQAEFDLDAAQTMALRAHNLLYDEDGGGAYYQLYAQSIFDGFFFEIVQRRGRYAGFGARNASVRLAAQTQAQNRQDATHTPHPQEPA